MSGARLQVMKERDAFKAGARLRYHKGYRYADKALDAEAEGRYPMPTYKQPRILKVPNRNPMSNRNRPFSEYKVEDGKLWYRFPTIFPPTSRPYTGDNWQCAYNESPETLAAKIELFRNPTEEVEIP